MALKLNRAKLPGLHMPPVDPNTAVVDYDAETDTLFFRRAVAPAASVNIDGEVWLRVDPTSGEVYGFEIEGFEHDFLKRHKDLLKIWKSLNDKRSVRLTENGAYRLVHGIWRVMKDLRVPPLRFAGEG